MADNNFYIKTDPNAPPPYLFNDIRSTEVYITNATIAPSYIDPTIPPHLEVFNDFSPAEIFKRVLNCTDQDGVIRILQKLPKSDPYHKQLHDKLDSLGKKQRNHEIDCYARNKKPHSNYHEKVKELYRDAQKHFKIQPDQNHSVHQEQSTPDSFFED
ncbi:MAG: hypothetical protein IK105_06270 [Thermoguttaceae bacterium]|nr:hypothetical protein [Thermoguttaceae bacterium]